MAAENNENKELLVFLKYQLILKTTQSGCVLNSSKMKNGK
jgi:hypothetical protein